MSENETGIARNIKAMEYLKTELLNSISGLFKALFKADTQKTIENLALLVINSYLLLKRMGISFGQLELQVYQKTVMYIEDGHPLEEWYGDLSAFKGYLDLKR